MDSSAAIGMGSLLQTEAITLIRTDDNNPPFEVLGRFIVEQCASDGFARTSRLAIELGVALVVGDLVSTGGLSGIGLCAGLPILATGLCMYGVHLLASYSLKKDNCPPSKFLLSRFHDMSQPECVKEVSTFFIMLGAEIVITYISPEALFFTLPLGLSLIGLGLLLYAIHYFMPAKITEPEGEQTLLIQ